MLPRQKLILLNRPLKIPEGELLVVVVRLLTFLFVTFYFSGFVQAQDPNNASTGGGIPVVDKELEVAMGIDVIEKVDFDFNTKMTIGNENLLRLQVFPQKREIIFKGLKPGKTTVLIRDNVGDVRLKYTIGVTATGKSNVVSELRELIGDVEGLEIGIKGGKVFVGGEIVVPDEIGRVSQVLINYPDVLAIIELSPQTQRVIARKMSDELARNGIKDVSVRIVNKVFWLEGIVSSDEKKKNAVKIASAYLPPKIATLSSKDSRYNTVDQPQILDFIGVNAAKEPPVVAKMIKITSQFVELSKNYGKVFAFKWAPLMGQDSSKIQFGQTASGNVTSTSSGTLSATISNLFPKLNSAKTAGYARVIQSGMVITKDNVKASIIKNTSTPYAIGTGDFQRAAKADVGLTLSVKPLILDQEKVDMQELNFSVRLAVGSDASITTDNNITTNLVIKSKESAAIGGVVQNQSVTDYDKSDPAPITGQAGPQQATPLFRLLRSKNYTTTKTQFVMFVTPEIIESSSTGTEEIRKKFRRRE
jgi:pilus assembly protein CpaC